MYALAYGMLAGNAIHNALKARGALSNINLTVPEAIRHAGDRVAGIHEWVFIFDYVLYKVLNEFYFRKASCIHNHLH